MGILPLDLPKGYEYLEHEAGRWIDFGSGHYGFLYDHHESMLEVHRTPADPSKWCGGFLDLRGPDEPDEPRHPGRPYWKVSSWEPLTMTPSVHCALDFGGCGAHGYITAGSWV